MQELKVFIPFQKKNKDKQIVEGIASSEVTDSQGEIVTIEAIKKALPDYMKFANIREMHQLSAVGKAISTEIDEINKALRLSCKVVDTNAWNKVKEGVYNGFSIGGAVLSKVGNKITELVLTEISLVDRPANPTAIFDVIKVKGLAKSDDESDEYKRQVFMASYILSLTKEIIYLSDDLDYMGRYSDECKVAITSLKALAERELRGENKKEVEDTLNKAFDLINTRTIRNNVSTNYFSNLRKVLG